MNKTQSCARGGQIDILDHIPCYAVDVLLRIEVLQGLEVQELVALECTRAYALHLAPVLARGGLLLLALSSLSQSQSISTKLSHSHSHVLSLPQPHQKKSKKRKLKRKLITLKKTPKLHSENLSFILILIQLYRVDMI